MIFQIIIAFVSICLTYTASLCLQNSLSVLIDMFLTSGRMLLERIFFIIRMISGVPFISTLWETISFQSAIVSHGLVFVSAAESWDSQIQKLTCDTLCYRQCTEIELGIRREGSEKTCLNMFYVYNLFLCIFMKFCASLNVFPILLSKKDSSTWSGRQGELGYFPQPSGPWHYKPISQVLQRLMAAAGTGEEPTWAAAWVIFLSHLLGVFLFPLNMKDQFFC